MPEVDFEVIVGVSSEVAQDEQTAIAEASRYLAYADQTDTFGYNGRVFAVDVYGGKNYEDEVLDYGVGLSFSTVIVDDDDLKSFMDEMAMLAHVETVERLGGAQIPAI